MSEAQEFSQDRKRGLPEEEETGEITTLYIIGMPADVRYREVYNFLRFFLGFERVTVSQKRHLPSVFATFDSRDNAMSALTQLNGLQFDPDLDMKLKVELAKSNTSSRGPRENGGGVHTGGRPPFKKLRADTYGGGFGFGASQATGFMANQYYAVPEPALYDMGFAQQQVYGSYPQPSAYAQPSTSTAAAPQRSVVTTQGTGMGRPPQGNPINTLFVHGIDGASELDIEAFFQHFPGFVQANFSRKRGLVAWAQFASTEQASSAANQMNGTVVTGAPASGMEVDFAKSEMSGTGRGGRGGMRDDGFARGRAQRSMF